MNTKKPSLLERIAARMGYSVMASWRLQRLAQAGYLQRLFHSAAVDCVFDVGANTGQFRDFLRQEVRYEGLIISYEPIPEIAEALKMRAKSDPAWIVESCALGRAEEVRLFNVMNGSDFSSFLDPVAAFDSAFGKRNQISRQVEVEIKILASEFDRQRKIHLFNYSYLKCDTQGFDLEVISGAGDRLQNFVAMQVEASVQQIYSGMPKYSETITQLEALGMFPSAFFPVNESLFPELVEFDCHLVNRSHVDRIRGLPQSL